METNYIFSGKDESKKRIQLMEIRKCNKCGYETITSFPKDYKKEHKNCGGLLRLISGEERNG